MKTFKENIKIPGGQKGIPIKITKAAAVVLRSNFRFRSLEEQRSMRGIAEGKVIVIWTTSEIAFIPAVTVSFTTVCEKVRVSWK